MAPAMAMHWAVQVRDVEKEAGTALTSRLQVAMVPTPRAQPGEVVVHMTCRPVHPADLLSLAGTYPPWQPPSLPATLGLEGMGVVHEVTRSAHAATECTFIHFRYFNHFDI